MKIKIDIREKSVEVTSKDGNIKNVSSLMVQGKNIGIIDFEITPKKKK